MESSLETSSQLLVIIPTYNEAENIAGVLSKLFSLALPLHVLVVDDRSPDGTATRVKDLQPPYDGRLFLLERGGKQGLRAAYFAGFAWAQAQNRYQWIQHMDADGQHDPQDVARFYQYALEHRAQVVVGQRRKEGMHVGKLSFSRTLLTRCGYWYVRFLLGIKLNDLTTGFKLYSVAAIDYLIKHPCRAKHYIFQMESLYLLRRGGFRLDPLDIAFHKRLHGQSKLSFRIIIEAIYFPLLLRLRRDT